MSESKAQDELLTQDEAAARLKISRFTMGDWLRAGKIKGIKVGKLWRVRGSALEDFLRNNESER